MKTIFLLFCMVLGVQVSANSDSSPDFSNLSEKLSTLNKRLSDNLSMSIVWEENTEVVEIQSYPPLKRMAAIQSIIEVMTNNDKKLFPDSEQNQYQFLLRLTSRFVALRYINELVGETDDEIVMKSYLNGELADLQLVLSGKFPYEFYLKSHQDRNIKLMYLYGGNVDFLREALKLIKSTSIINISNKTSALSLLEACVDNIEICESM